MKYALILLLCVFGMSCQKSELMDASPMATANMFLAKWKLIEFENNQAVKFETYIEITKHKDTQGLYVINGKGPVNFFFMNCEIDFNANTMKMGNINGTEIAVNVLNGEIENDLLQRFSESVNFEYSNDRQNLTFYNAKKTKSLKFKLN
jgi:META domain